MAPIHVVMTFPAALRANQLVDTFVSGKYGLVCTGRGSFPCVKFVVVSRSEGVAVTAIFSTVRALVCLRIKQKMCG